MFELDVVGDLVLPRAGSTTGRALASMVRRRCFEQLKACAVGAHPAATETSLEAIVHALAQAFAARLPGDPHAISALVSEPPIGVLLRRGLRGDDGDAPYLAIGLERLLVGLGDRPVNEPASPTTTVRGRLRLVHGDAWLLRCVGVDEAMPVPPGLARALADALASLESVAPGLAADVERFASTMVVSITPPHALPPWSVGLALVPPTDDPEIARDALVASVVVGKLHALVDGRAHDPVRRVRLAREASALACARVDEALRARRGQSTSSHPIEVADDRCPPDDPLAQVVAEVRALAGRAKLDA